MDELVIYSWLGKAVATRRKIMKLTQAEVAKAVGISRASIANIESGRQKVLLHQVYGLAKALDLKTITELVPATLPKPGNVQVSDMVTLSGDPVSEAQMFGVEQLLKSALGQPSANSAR